MNEIKNIVNGKKENVFKPYTKSTKSGTERMKVLMVTSHEYPFLQGGIESYIDKVSMGLVERGIDLFVIARSVKAQTLNFCCGRKEVVTFSNPRWYFPVIDSIFKTIRSTVTIIRLVKKKHIDIIHVHDSQFGGLDAIFAGFVTSRPVAFHLHAHTLSEHQRLTVQHSLRRHIDFALYKLWDKVVFHFADYVIATSFYSKNKLLKFGVQEKKISVIYNFVDIGEFKPLETKTDKNNTIVFVGRLEREKDVPCLLRAFSEVLQQEVLANLTIVGSGSMRNLLEQIVGELNLKDRVNFLGARSDIANILNSAKVFVLPSIVEGMPISVLEAMAVGKAVIVTNVGGIPEVVKDGENGLVFIPTDHKKLAKLIQTVLLDEELAISLGKNARQSIEANFALESHIKKLLSFYHSIIRVN